MTDETNNSWQLQLQCTRVDNSEVKYKGKVYQTRTYLVVLMEYYCYKILHF